MQQSLNLTTITTLTTINYFFNASGASISYTAPDGSTEALASNSYELWIGNNKSGGDDQTGSNGDGGFPTAGVDTLILQTFNGQAPGVYTFDNFEFNTIDVVPEPSSGALIALGLGLGLTARRRKNR